jgi:aminopeptidase YwaD
MGNLLQYSAAYLNELCVEITDRSVGSDGNRAASYYFESVISSLGWSVETQEFDAIDWIDGGASLGCGEAIFEVKVSPYSLGCSVEGKLIAISSVDDLEKSNIASSVLLLHGDIAKEQLMPKNFVFYNPEHHQRIISLLENGGPKAIICATGRNAALAGGVYPFPLIEDGDFDIPSVYLTEEEGERLASYAGKTISLKSISSRVPGKGCNVVARKGSQTARRIVVTAHIDAKKGTPGAIDNATGVVTLLLLAKLLKDYAGKNLIEIVALNGEDYYAVSGQMRYLQDYQDRFDQIALNINIDGAGYKRGMSALSFYGLTEEVEKKVMQVIHDFDGLTEGDQWVQGDHSMFIQNGCPAIAVTSDWFSAHIDSQEITHTSKDNIEIVDCSKLVEIAVALNRIIGDY